MTNSNHTTVLISGATGFIAQHIISQLLAKGYKVVGSVRSTQKGEGLVKIFENSNFSYEVVPILEKEGAFDEVLKKHPSATVFLHTASPATFEVEDNEKDIIIPALEGTKFVLKSIKEHAPQITRVVYTSSMAATGTAAEILGGEFKGGEDTWNSITYEQSKENGFNAYCGSKTFAEKAAWDFVEKEKPNFTLSTINPGYAFGPQNAAPKTRELNSSAQMVASVLNATDSVPPISGPFVDVRDVAKAHISAFETEKAQGKRFVLSNSVFNGQTILDIIVANFPQLKDKLPTGTPGVSVSGPTAFNDKNAKSILSIDYISLEKSVVDSIKQIIDL
ncbi:protein induced by osmotic stress [Scheffersomyces amazonensis]|uniref:protein induced by osmotic stress n=1 Tax=Scheffersomyces amazonensis TaxID=1078765 RepID=UPI00315D7E02